VVLSCDDVPVQPLPETGNQVGVDLATGANGLGWTSDGGQLHNPRAFKTIERKLATLQREADRRKPKPRQRASATYKRLQARIAALYAKAARIRRDNHHKQAVELVRRYDVIAVEDIATANMTRRPKPKPDPHNPERFLANNASAKSSLSKSILDAGWSQFLAILTAKAECAGRLMVTVNPAYTSQTCHRCGNVDVAARHGKIYTCTNPTCNYTGDADVNAGIGILRAGLVQLAAAHAAA
jgi:putative transposase